MGKIKVNSLIVSYSDYPTRKILVTTSKLQDHWNCVGLSEKACVSKMHVFTCVKVHGVHKYRQLVAMSQIPAALSEYFCDSFGKIDRQVEMK